MFLKPFASIVIVTSAFILAIGQTPEKKGPDKAPPTFSWAFESDGAYLGVQTSEVSRDNYGKFGLSSVRGVVVDKVIDSSPAAAAGLQAGDVILRFNGEELTGTRKLSRLVSEAAPDHRVTLTILRGGREQELTATLGKQPAARFGAGNFSFSFPEKFEFEHDLKKFPQLRDHFQLFKDNPQWKEKFELFKDHPNTFSLPPGGESFSWRPGEGRQIGVSVYAVTKQLGERFGTDGGVMISEVRDSSPAAKAGLRAGDIIVEVGGKAIRNNFDLIKAINQAKEGDVQVTIVRDRSRQTLTVTPEPSKDAGFFFYFDKDSGE